MMRSRVRGQAELRHVQGIIRVAPAQIQAQMAAGMRRELKKVEPEVKAEAGATLPKRGGYAGVMSAAAKAATSVRQAGNRITARVTVSAKGKKEDRDVAAVNLGRLRHPVFGNRKVWRVTTVLPGFVDRPIDNAKERIVDVAKEARDDAAERIVHG